MEYRYWTKSFPIIPTQLIAFTNQFQKGKPLKDLKLCSRIEAEWIKGLKTEFPKEKVKSGGVYAIFTRPDRKGCFYVGMSEGNVITRINTHLTTDIKKNYRGVFKKLRGEPVFRLCYATVKTADKRVMSKKRKLERKRQLILLEHCLTTVLRPSSFSS